MEREPVAITGIGCYMPGHVRGPAAFWKLLCDEVDAVTTVPESRWNMERFAEIMQVRGGAFLDDIEGFDAAFFGVSPREASVMDPMQRMLLEVTWEALEDAGVVPERLAGESVCVYAGAFALDYKLLQLNSTEDDHIGIHTSTGVAATLVANRISHWFDLRGASVTIDTACSSSMTALHLACRELWEGRSEMALAAGGNVIFYPEWTLAADRGGFLSPDGRCKAFADRADGYGRGEGAAVLVIKPLSRAMADNDRVYAVIRGTAINQDGHTDGLTVPRADAQESVMRAACADAGIDPQLIRYVEAHGTGTPVGDPIEASAIGRVYGTPEPEEPCLIGSVKSNMAHLEAAAGVAGVIKAALSLYHGRIPATLRFGALNRAIDFDGLGLRVVDHLEDFPETDHGCFAGVNSFGFGGANGHAVLQRIEPCAEPVEDISPYFLLPVSAKTSRALQTMVERYSAYLEEARDARRALKDLCYSAAVRRQHLARRAVLMVKKQDGHKHQSTAFGLDAHPEGKVRGKTAFVFSGMGTQWLGMADELLAQECVCAEIARPFDACFTELAGWSLLDAMADEARIHSTEVTQPAIVLVQVMLQALWRTRGVVPDMITGHSLGELSAAYAAGCLSLNDLVTLVFHRSRLQATLAERGGMLAVALSVTDLHPLIAGLDGVAVAAVNSPCSVTLAGAVDALNVVSDRLNGQHVFNRMLRVSVPYHTPIMEEIRDAFLEAVRNVRCAPAQVPLYSSQTGDLLKRPDADYWYGNLRNTVHFEQAIGAMQEGGAGTFLEISPHAVLLQSIRECCDPQPVETIPSLLRDRHAAECMATATAQLYCCGCDIDWASLYPGGRLISLPLYAWQHRRFWNESARSRQRRIGTGACLPPDSALHESSLDRAHEPSGDVISLEQWPYLAGHRIQDAVIFPATGYLAQCFDWAESQFKEPSCNLAHVRFLNAWFLEEPSEMRVVPDSGRFEIQRRSMSSPEWHVYASGEVSTLSAVGQRGVTLDDLFARCPEDQDVAAFYEALRQVGYQYEGAFRSVEALRVGSQQAVSHMANAEGHSSTHPALLDGALQTLLAAVMTNEGRAGLDKLYLPVEIESVCLYQTVRGAMYAHAVLREFSEHYVVGDVTVYDKSGAPLVTLEGVACKGIAGQIERPGASKNVLYHLVWEEQPLPNDAHPADGEWFIYPDVPGRRSIEQGVREHGGTMHVIENVASMRLEHSELGGGTANMRGVIFNGTSSELVSLVQTLVAGNIATRLIILTCGVVSGHGVSQAELWGVGRVAANEHPELDIRLIDLERAPEWNDRDETLTAMLLEELCRQPSEGEVYLADGKRRVCRIQPYASRSSDHGTMAVHTDQDACRLVCHTSGRLDDVVAVSIPREKPRSDEVEIQVCAAGINFKDVLKARGLLDPANLQGNYRGPSLGLECAGRIVSVGTDVEGLQVGDEVFGFASGAFGSYAITKAELVRPKPRTWSFEEAASFPVAYVTAWYGLHELAHLRSGETVLIHAATGGVGQAAVHVARMLGAHVMATAGSEPKRLFLRKQGIEHVFDSRSDSFVEAVRTVTQGKGVDVVLNSLSGELLDAGLHTLSSFGRFIEIGKRDIDTDRAIHLQPFRKNISFCSVDLDALLFERAEYGQQMLAEITKRVGEQGTPFPLPIQSCRLSGFRQAFQMMLNAEHVGKLVLSVAKETVEACPAPRDMLFRDAAYLITGGLSGLGLATALEMAQRGAQHLILVSRSGNPRTDAEPTLQHLHAMGVVVQIEQVDVGDEQQMAALFERLFRTTPPLRGIIHSATVYEDGYIAQITDEQLDHVLHPKAQGARLLHEQTRHMPLDFFVMYSSISSTIGNPGQANYAAANSFLESLAALRHQQGLPALTINWGAIQETGYVEQHAQVVQHLKRSGIHGLSLRRVFDSLWFLLRDGATQALVADVDWHAVQGRSSSGTSKKYEHVAHATRPHANTAYEKTSLANALEGLAAKDRVSCVEHYLRGMLAEILGHADAADIDASQGFFDMGLDSMLAMEFTARLETVVNRTLPATVVFRYPTLHALAEFVLSGMNLPAEKTEQTELTREDVRSLLEQELNDEL